VPATYTPLRYPGGKSKLGPYLSDVVRANGLIGASYAEPYAGGAGAAMYLLFRGYCDRLYLNDIDRGVVAFWRAILAHPERFAREIESIPLTVPQWDLQKEIVRSARSGFELGFAFFYLNRTNRSGIMNAGVIGGRDQSGNWTMEARFTRSDLADRVRAIGRMRRSISITRLDAMTFLDELQEAEERCLTYLDPPYFAKGQDLYPNHYSPEDHEAIARRLADYTQPWILTYDDCPEIRELYADSVLLDSELSYSAREVRRGREVLVFGGGLEPVSHSKASEGRRGFAVV
jgi:DNA adenine methylase